MDGSLAGYGVALELCFFVNAIYSMWSGLYKRIVKRQEALAEGAARVDSALASENFETIAVRMLYGTVKWGERVREVLWYAARIVGGVFAVAIYVGAVSLGDTPFSTVPLVAWIGPAWFAWVEWGFAYLSTTLILAMALVSALFDFVAKRQIAALNAVVDRRLADRDGRRQYGDLADHMDRRRRGR